MEDWRGSVGERVPESEGLQEENVIRSVMNANSSSSSAAARRSKSSAPMSIRRSGGSGGQRQQAQWSSSAPVDIPDWSSKRLRKLPERNRRDGGGDDDECAPAPPHEYLARRLSTAAIASFSMCEGIGGTLKGRDQTKLRNAILTKTGFLE